MTSPTVSGLGEAGILQVLHGRFRTVPAAQDWPEGSLGPGDDAAVVPAPDGRFVISTDAMAQDRDFRLVWPSGAVDSGYSTGWKAAAQNLSDINAMGGTARHLTIGLAAPADLPVAWALDFARGFAEECASVGATAR